MIVAVTGHRPDKLGGYKTPNHVYNAVMAGMDKALDELKPSCVITGMALGVDQWMAELCLMKGIPYVAAIPFDGQDSVWFPESKAKFAYLVKHAQAAYVISPGPYEAKKMHIRNRWMVDSAQAIIAVWNGSPGGTAACVGYAQACAKYIHWVQIPPEIWQLAVEMAPLKKPNTFGMALPPNKAIAELTVEEAKVKLSPFVSLVKEKAEAKAQELLKQTEQANFEKKKFKDKLKQELTDQQIQKVLAQVDYEKKPMLMGVAEVMPKHPSSKYQKKMLEEQKKVEDNLKYHRVMDLDD